MSLYRLFLRSITTRGRVVVLTLFGAVAVFVAMAITRDTTDAEALERGVHLINGFGLQLFVPVATLVFASAVLGDPNEDGTLVYVWLKPIPRWQIAVAAVAAALTVSLPIVVIPLVIAASVMGVGADLVVATAAACALATVAYTGVFTWVGLRLRRSLLWGLTYVLIWEGFVAEAGVTPARFAIRAHARSVLTRIADGPDDLVTVTLRTGVIAPILAFVAGTLLTIRRLRRQDVA